MLNFRKKKFSDRPGMKNLGHLWNGNKQFFEVGHLRLFFNHLNVRPVYLNGSLTFFVCLAEKRFDL